jgi:hypothetical protein
MKRVAFLLVTVLLCPLCLSGCARRAPRPEASGGDFRPFVPGMTAGSLAELDAKNGFRDLRFRGPVAEGMKLAETQDYVRTESYVRPGETMRIGRAEVREIRYVYYRGGLTTVVIVAKGSENARALLDELEAAYGPSEMPKQSLVHRWRGKRAVAFYSRGAEGSLVKLWSRPMIARLVRDERAVGEPN